MKGTDSGKVPVKIEVVISGVEDSEYGYELYMWIKGEKGYYYKHKSVDTKYLSELDAFPERPVKGQRIIYEITPYSDGGFSGSQIKSFQIIDEDVDLNEIKPAELVTSTALRSNEDNYQKSCVVELVIGDKYEDSYEAWIKDEDGYDQISLSLSFTPEYGQRIIVVLKPWNLIVYSDEQFEHYIATEKVDVKEIENNYFLANEVTKHYVDPFDAANFETYPYKRIMRDLEGYKGTAICIEGKYQQILDDSHGLMSDNDGNYYHLYIRKEALNFKLLEKDKIRVYGYVLEKPYEYSSWTGDKTVPSILVKRIDLLEDD